MVKAQENVELGLGFNGHTHFLKLCKLYTQTLGSSFLLI